MKALPYLEDLSVSQWKCYTCILGHSFSILGMLQKQIVHKLSGKKHLTISHCTQKEDECQIIDEALIDEIMRYR